jgi:hypothetical protein
VEQTDRLELIERLQLRPQHPRLNRERDEQKQIVTRYAEQPASRNREYRSKEKPDEKTGSRLFRAEI